MRMLSRLLWRLAEWPIALGWHAYASLLRLTSQVSVAGTPPGEPAIFVNWHRYQCFLILHHGAHRRWLLVSPAPAWAPVARFCRLSGLKLVRGASGDRGQHALDELSQVLGTGGSVTMAVDGPAGPGFQAKRGCADLSRRTGAPIIPVNFQCRRGVTLGWRWDRMIFPMPFDHIVIRYGRPIASQIGAQGLLEAVQHRLTLHETA
jgi:lysophospholipid acyltransferase (LPLAT)-like uncharacterized protein